MPAFKIAAAQVASVRGDIARNVSTHADAIEAAAGVGVSALIFPELSLTGYEPDLAAETAIAARDDRLAPLLSRARRHRMEVVLGAPLHNGEKKPQLGAVVLGADGGLRTYAKMHLGGDEPNHFEPGDAMLTVSSHGRTIGLAICADASRPSHPSACADAGATIYAAGVFLNEEWYSTDAPRFESHARTHRMLVLMANHADSIGTYTSVGKSAVWGPDGAPIARAKGAERCLVIATNDGGAWSGEVVEF